jgi:hypothetical protein
MIEKTQIEINEWELAHLDRIIKWEKDFEKNTITFWLIFGDVFTFKTITNAQPLNRSNTTS